MNTWQEELSSALKTQSELQQFFGQDFPSTPYPIMIPLKLAKKIKSLGANSPLWKQFLPTEEENSSIGLNDPIADEKFLVAGQLVHRYHNRVLFLPSSRCPVICRYCFRKNELYQASDLFQNKFDEVISYLQSHTEINEIIFSGGDPLILNDQKLFHYLNSFSQLENIKYIRFHTRFPVIIPARITADFVSQLEEYAQSFSKIIFVIHINHADEISSEFKATLLKLTNTPNLLLLSQSVLLKGVNDCESSLLNLFNELHTLNVKPYYLHHPDKVKGAIHFDIPLKKGEYIYQALRKKLPGWMLPHYVIEQPEGKGKISAINFENTTFF